MNELTKTTNAISNCETKEIVPQVMAMCRAITPQFYKGMSDMDIKAEKLGIDLLTANIEQKCLGEMCKLAIMNYPRFRSENPKTYFDINYILTFYKQAFNKMFCELVELPKKSNRLKSSFDEELNILTETWETPTGEIVEIKEIIDKPRAHEHTYSSKYYSTLFDNLDDLEI